MPIEIPTEKKRKAWAKNLAKMDEPVRSIASRFDPWGRYMMTDTGQIVRIDAFYQDGTLLVWIDDELNDPSIPTTGCQVFGIDPDLLIPWTQPFDA